MMMRFGAALALVITCAVGSAQAHGPYAGKVDPAYNNNCCGGSDCATIPSAWIKEIQDGFNLRMSVDQAKTINPLAMLPVDAVIPHGRVQPSWDSDYHGCIFPKDRSQPRGGVICFWVPMLT
jgi:hypothetical protein